MNNNNQNEVINISCQTEQAEEKLIYLQELVANNHTDEMAQFLAKQSEYEIANLIESFPSEHRDLIWSQVPESLKGEVLSEIDEEVRLHIAQNMTSQEVSALTEDLDSQEIAEILESVDDTVRTQVMATLDEDVQSNIITLHQYEADQVGSYMDPETIQIQGNMPLVDIQTLLRSEEDLLDDETQELLVVDENKQLLGLLSLVDLIKYPQTSLAHQWADTAVTVNDEMDIHDASALFRAEDIHYAPVINEQGELVGQLNAEDIMEIIQDDVDSTMKRIANVSEDEELFAPIVRSAKSRSFWLGINLLTALAAAFVIGRFEAVLEQVVALAVLMPVVASMGGIAGSQTLTVIIRGLAMGQIGGRNRLWLVNKETWVGAINGIIWAVVVAFIAQVWFHDSAISLIIGLAIAINMTVANVAGISIPLLLKQMHIDPALSASVILTTVTDIVGFLTFLGLASLIIL